MPEIKIFSIRGGYEDYINERLQDETEWREVSEEEIRAISNVINQHNSKYGNRYDSERYVIVRKLEPKEYVDLFSRIKDLAKEEQERQKKAKAKAQKIAETKKFKQEEKERKKLEELQKKYGANP